MAKKSKSTCEPLFETFKDVAREKDIEIKVETIRTDFEEAAIKAATKVFDVGIECCFFPFMPSPLEKDSGSWSTPNIH